MSSNFTGVTFAEQRVTPADDAQIRRAIFFDCILSGCALSYSGSTLTMAAGSLIACGRQIRHPSTQNWPVVDATSGYARLLLTIDLTKTSSADAFDQVVESIEYASAVNGFSTLVQDDINRNGTKYQIEICVVELGAGGITGFVSKLGSNLGMWTKYIAEEESFQMVKVWENENPTISFAAQTVTISTLASYTHVGIVADWNCGADQRQLSGMQVYELAKIKNDKAVLSMCVSGQTGNRGVRYNGTTGLVFESGKQGSSEQNNTIVPNQIYGIKGVSW